MSDAKKYRRCAAECLKLSLSARESGDKVVLTDMAVMWHRLAEHAEAHHDFDSKAVLIGTGAALRAILLGVTEEPLSNRLAELLKELDETPAESTAT